ncbi:DNA polymerase-3 subunit epsilon [Persephonella hydrogeniphila]|uniref:DNA polymerase-3 subunit epsilon n=1 Tax=Persephonella hydrogeniphila TaxID=198703 RepID=A0A285NHD8_9AQUI|nr:3'-5' exonuclease [Persephonella hydrogeniphila]SNZ08890.1 DNA polymerase-3 subunit epsilon [Persephonella hydrogeniphila]
MDFLRKIQLYRYRKNPYFPKFYSPIKEKSIEKITFCSFDLETTGLDPKKDEIVSIGAVKIKKLKIDIGTQFYKLVKPEKHLEKENILIHGITMSELENAPSPENVIPEFLEYIKGTVLVGYFVRFDISVLSRYTQKMFGIPVLNPFIDLKDVHLLNLQRSYTPAEKIRESSLEELAIEYGIPVEKRHNALYDSIISALLFIAMVKKHRQTVEKLLSKLL